MISNVCRIKKGDLDLNSILKETEKVTAYNGLTGTDALALRLLSEEVVSMLPSIVKNFDGEFWIENDENEYSLHVRMSVENMDIETRENLIKVSKNNRNASVVGVTGKIRAVFDYMALGNDEAAMVLPASRYGFGSSMDFSYIWSLQQYRENVSKDETEKWDEFEKSIIARIADDVVVGVKGKKVNIIIKKDFNK